MSNPMKDIFDKESMMKDIAERENIICNYQKYGLLDRENAIKKIQELRRDDENVAAITSVKLAIAHKLYSNNVFKLSPYVVTALAIFFLFL